MPIEEKEQLANNKADKMEGGGTRLLPSRIISVPRKFLAVLILIYGVIVGVLVVLRMPFFYGLGIALLLVVPLWFFGKRKSSKNPEWLEGDK